MTDSPPTSPSSPVPELTAAAIRVLGCLVEKEATVPRSYPLTLNSLRTACNQSTNRKPVVDYDERTVELALDLLRAEGLIRVVYSTSNRATKYRHVVPEALGLGDEQVAALSILMLRGAQTVGEVKQRSERLHGFASTDEVATVLAGLRHAGLVRPLDREPGQKDVRWIHLLGGQDEAPAGAPPAEIPVPPVVEVDGVVVRDVREADRSSVVELWTACDLVRPWNDPQADIQRARRDGGWVLVALVDDALVGTVMVGDDGHRGWLNYLAVSAAHRRRGVGRLLVEVAEARLAAQGCPKVNLQIRDEHAAAADFYEAVGFELEDVISMGKRLDQD